MALSGRATKKKNFFADFPFSILTYKLYNENAILKISNKDIRYNFHFNAGTRHAGKRTYFTPIYWMSNFDVQRFEYGS